MSQYYNSQVRMIRSKFFIGPWPENVSTPFLSSHFTFLPAPPLAAKAVETVAIAIRIKARTRFINIRMIDY